MCVAEAPRFRPHQMPLCLPAALKDGLYRAGRRCYSTDGIMR
jgi:hypothetical protein